jgi:thymidylate synthase (EC 2.1.1.45)
MQAYLDLIREVLTEGRYKPNRTGVDTIASFSAQYTVDLTAGFPLLTTKDLSGFRWNSLLHELIWYLSGEEHIRTLREHTGIWDAWADDAGQLDTAYGRFWRRYPLAAETLPGESWATAGDRWINDDGTFDQIRYVLDTLQADPHSRRMVVSAWHPANAAVSTLPPCHYTFVVSVQDGALHLHLTQRSGDVALGIPFNIAAYALLAQVLAQRSGFRLGSFGHTIVDAHIYCGEAERGAWYATHLDELHRRLEAASDPAGIRAVAAWVEQTAPAESRPDFDHVPGLLEQLARTPRSRPQLRVEDVPIDDLRVDHIQLEGYDPAGPLRFAVAE